MNVPELRFKGLDKTWNKKTLDELVQLNSGMDYKHLCNGNIPVYGTGGYMLSVNAALSYDKDAIGIGRKGTINKPYILKAPFWTVDTLFYAIPRKYNNLQFCNCLFQRIDWLKYDESTGVPSLSKNIINSIEINCAPSYDEQQKIASYFQSLDSLIQSISKKLVSLKQIKAASLQSMFPQEGETVPKVRFKGFEEEWEKIQLNNCLNISNNINIHNTYGINDVLSISDEAGVVNQIEFLGRSFAGKSLQKYKILKTDQLVYTKSPLKAKPYGIIKNNSNRTGIVSTLYAIYDCKDNVSPEFIHYYFDPCYRINQYLSPLVNKGAKNTMNISDETALSGEIWIPSLQEQQKIASYFCNLDKQISLQTQHLEKLKQIKAACLDKMFV